MLKQVESVFPDQIDPIIFFQDTNLDTLAIKTTYDALIAAGKYDSANEYIATQTRIYGYWADYLNAIENRIYATQEYATSMAGTVLITERTSYDDEPEVGCPTHEDLEVYTHEELEELCHGFMDPDEYMWISDAEDEDDSEDEDE